MAQCIVFAGFLGLHSCHNPALHTVTEHAEEDDDMRNLLTIQQE